MPGMGVEVGEGIDVAASVGRGVTEGAAVVGAGVGAALAPQAANANAKKMPRSKVPFGGPR
ncbi:MAG: hypothetical protein BZY81_02715 [SAR202 cluster bacterium Io17-Chloro-G4]|nr:MAG: hypothetical protein BZY81_02715 [SAR202 cluster bacterium Io17-Chloro-G4]